MKEQLVNTIEQKLLSVKDKATKEFRENKLKYDIGFCSIDDLLPADYANKIYEKFDSKNSAWRLMDSFREKKLTTKQYDMFDPMLKDITFAFQDKRILSVVESITGIQNQQPDSHLYAGGLSMMREGDFLDPHIDNSHDQFQKVYRRLNLLYYVTPNWSLNDGGNLELWDKDVKQPVVITSAFNRLVLMETHPLSWHSVSKVTKSGGLRACVSNYYFSEESPVQGKHYYHVTSFMARPTQPLKRMLCKVDNNLRSLLRAVNKDGFGKKDLYQKGINK